MLAGAGGGDIAETGAAGIVDAVGEGVDALTVGDRVAGLSPDGAAAEYAVTYTTALVRTPEGIDAAFDLVIGGEFDVFSALVKEGGALVTLLDPEVPARGGILVTGTEQGYEGALQQVLGGVASGAVVVPIEDVLPIGRIAEARDRSAAGRVRGKPVLSIGA
ncbi:zinc-binding dehydrogenase [Streptomyces termitum]|uniref:Uncharacterized protein n=1 Tax=Streptomyces termitum TaxID=67368 RepID=A0A918T9M5_9ACTN|nr:zinc-binding dehydrogenase [Streptomyces termitum]GHB11346.1 hypothetical protein GCM10010305_62540 [Streptomyces termitum]